MTKLAHRLGDLIDDYCPRCRLLLNHAVASLMDAEVAKVICQTCYSEHPFRHGEGGKKKNSPSGRSALFSQVLSKTRPSATPSPVPPADPPDDSTQNPIKKKSAVVARYISRHKTKPRKVR